MTNVFNSQVQMMSAVSGEPMLRRVKQETDPSPQYSPPEPQSPHAQPLHPRQMPMMQPPEVKMVNTLFDYYLILFIKRAILDIFLIFF